MPLMSFEGSDGNDLADAITHVEKTRQRVVQVVGNYDNRWYLLVEPKAVSVERRDLLP